MTHEPELSSSLDTLWRDGVLQRYGERYETTRRWRAARHRMSSAAEPASERVDLRNPIVQALLAYYGDRHTLTTLSPYVAVLYALERSERTARGTPTPRR
jgi:hypothetical protein